MILANLPTENEQWISGKKNFEAVIPFTINLKLH